MKSRLQTLPSPSEGVVIIECSALSVDTIKMVVLEGEAH